MQFAWPNIIVLLPGCEASAINRAEGFGLQAALVLYFYDRQLFTGGRRVTGLARR